MSGGVQEQFDLRKIDLNNNKDKINRKQKEIIWNILMQARRKKSVICCNIEPNESLAQQELANGLVAGHAYIVSALTLVSIDTHVVRLLKCINPWGTETEYKGNWSWNSKYWKLLKRSDRKTLLTEVQINGHFWFA